MIGRWMSNSTKPFCRHLSVCIPLSSCIFTGHRELRSLWLLRPRHFCGHDGMIQHKTGRDLWPKRPSPFHSFCYSSFTRLRLSLIPLGNGLYRVCFSAVPSIAESCTLQNHSRLCSIIIRRCLIAWVCFFHLIRRSSVARNDDATPRAAYCI